MVFMRKSAKWQNSHSTRGVNFGHLNDLNEANENLTHLTNI